LFPDPSARQFNPVAMRYAFRPSMPKRRPSGRRRRPFALRGSTLAWLAVICMALAFAAGVAWQRTAAARAQRVKTASGPAPEEQAAARRLLESAITARFADQPDEALRLAREARETDPMTPGAATFSAEIALQQGKTDEVDTAAREAIRQGRYVADAKLLLALNRWLGRTQSDADGARAAATQLLAEATAEELSNGTARFFAGDLQRAVGRPGEAHRSLLGGLHRQEPWHSAALLSAKMRLAAAEAAPLADPNVPASSAGGDAFSAPPYDMHRALQGGDEVVIAAARSTLQGAFTGWQLGVLARDPAFAAAELMPTGEGPAVPFALIPPPAVKKESKGSPIP
jgi:hypothetical protein